MAIKINFDVTHNPEEPTLILAKKNGDKLGKINAKAIEISDNLNDASEITFNVYKYIDDQKDPLWDLITNFKLVYCLEMDEWFEATAEVDESNETMKTVFCTQLGHAELGQIMLYDIAINTDGEEGDIARDDYVIPTVLYRENGNLGEGITDSDVKFYKETQKKEMKFPFEDYREASLLHRILKDKAPHYSIAYVDPTISHMQRTFEFDDTSICDALAEIAEEINCIFVFNAYMDDDGIFRRTISAYDLESNCLNPDCKHRGDFLDVCPECDSTNIRDGYGEDTTIFVTADELADDIQLTTDVDAIKNCFKLEAGDNLMTATIKSCNPNGSDYIWYLSDEMKADMSAELVSRIGKYDEEYEEYQTKEIELDAVVKIPVLQKPVPRMVIYSREKDEDYSVTIKSSKSYYIENGKVVLDNPITEVFSDVSDLETLRGKYVYFPVEPTDLEQDVVLISVASIFEENEDGSIVYTSVSECRKVTVQEINSLSAYNELVDKYNNLMNRQGDDKFETIEVPIKGFPDLIDAYYNTFDMSVYLESGLMPTIDTARPSIDEEIVKLTADNLLSVAVNVSSTSSNPLKASSISTVDNIVLQMAKTLIDSRYKVKVADGSTLGFYVVDEDGNYVVDENGNKKYFIDNTENKDKYYKDGTFKYWRGNFILTAYSDDEVTKSTNDNDPSYYIEIEVNDNYETYVKNKLDKVLSAEDDEDMSISGLFKKDLAANFVTSDREYFKDYDGNYFAVGAKEEESFQYALKQYSLHRLKSFYEACESCKNIMIEMNVANGETWGKDLYDKLYLPYCNKQNAIIEEIAVRDAEIAIVAGLQTIIEDIKTEIQNALDFEKFLIEVDEKLWLEFCSFRREDKYSNDNYISEGKNNAEIIDLAKQFIETAKKEIYKSAERQHSISASLKNLLVIKKFEPLVKHFKVGNWLRVMIDDQIYKLRLINYEIDYDNLDEISVEFSDTVKANSSIKSVKDVLAQASSMATSYSSVQRQASKGEESKAVINDWFSSGLDATNVKIVGGADGQSQTWDNHGMLFREYDDATGEYSPEQMKIINSTMAITTDNWNTTKTAVGKYYYTDPKTGEMKMGYGINAETIIGKLILGQNIDLRNESGSMTFDDNGLIAENKDETNKVIINPDDDKSVFTIQSKSNGKDYEDVLSFDEDGNLEVKGRIIAEQSDIKIQVTDDSGNVETVELHDVAISGKYSDLINPPNLTVYAKSENLADVATSGSYKDLIDYDDLARVEDIPTVPTTATSITQNGANPVSGSAVYNYAVAKNQGTLNAGTLLYVGTDGNVTTLTIDGLKELLGI